MTDTQPAEEPADSGAVRPAWTPVAGETAYDRKTGDPVRVMSVHEFGVFVRLLKGGRERIAKLGDLIPPDGAPGGFQDWQAERG